MESSRKDEASSNIPHMHLFMSLKRRFPSLKDADITDSIQRFGLDKTRCEHELTLKSQEHHRNYYYLWNRNNRTPSRGSPLCPSETHSQVSSGLQNGSSPPAPLPGQQSKFTMNPTPSPDANLNLVEQFFDVSIGCVASPPPSGGSKAIYSNVACSPVSTSPAGSTPRCHGPPPPPLHDTGFAVDASNGLEKEPNSAPVIPECREPIFDPASGQQRRSSADTVPPERHARQDSPRTHSSHSSSLTNTTTTTSPPATSFCPTVTRTSFSHAPTSGQGTNQQPSPPRLAPAALQEQLARKERLREELDQRLEDRTKMEGEIKCLSEKLEFKEKSQRLDVKRSKQEIEMIQQDNSRLQLVCDEMERIILESGESPKTDQEGRVANDLSSPTFQDVPRIPTQLPMPNIGSNTSVSSGGGGAVTPTPSLIPSRKAPSPPVPMAATVSPPTTSQNLRTHASEEKGWSCSKCTFLNSPYLNECEICSFPHFSIVRDI